MNKNLGCVISCYNEEKNISKLISDIVKQNLNRKISFVIVNNASTDNTNKIFKELKNQHKNIRFVTNDINKGWGYGIKFGLKYIKTDIIGWTHSDLQYEIKDLTKVLNIIHDHRLTGSTNFLIKGNRIKRNYIDKFFSFIMQIICSLILKKKLRDINAQPVFINCDQLKNLKLPNGLEMDLDVYFKSIKNNSKIIRFDVIQHKRVLGKSSWNNSLYSKLKISIKFLKHAVKIKNG